MAYEKNTWQTGDVVTAAKLNNMEQGIANAVVVLHETNETLDKTWAEIKNLLEAGSVVVIAGTTHYGDGTYLYFVCMAQPATDVDPYFIHAISAAGGIEYYRYKADAEDEFPYVF